MAVTTAQIKFYGGFGLAGACLILLMFFQANQLPVGRAGSEMCADLRKKNDKLAGVIADTTEDLHELGARQKTLQTQLDEANDRLRDMSKKLNDKTAKLEKVQTETTDHEQLVKDLQAELKKKKAETKKLSEKLKKVDGAPVAKAGTVGGDDNKIATAKIAVMSMYDDMWYYQKLGEITEGNKRRYAEKHGYQFVAVEKAWIDTKRPTAFAKVKIIADKCAASEFDYVFWSDADAIIVNHNIKLESIIKPEADITLTKDFLSLHTGVFIVKCSQWSIGFLNRVYGQVQFDQDRAWEQGAIVHLYNKEPEVRPHFNIIPKKSLNVYQEEFIAGDFVGEFTMRLVVGITSGGVYGE
eukprot:GFYU01021317.1.p1 GENE.GFYU01021317.1~~GFYU01021317.1.p1  ORF type:complete len:408 (+),score=136.10 GFYU01021317.1:165-1226(+)